MNKHMTYGLGILLALAAILVASFWVASFTLDSEAIQQAIQDFGYVGIVVLGIVGGLNLFIPIPAAAFIPTLLASGFDSLGVVLALSLGTTIADLLGFALGVFGHHHVRNRDYQWYARLKNFKENHAQWTLPIVFLYAAFVPYPNEIVIVPLALMGYRLRSVLPVLFLGTIVYHTVLVFGAAAILERLF